MAQHLPQPPRPKMPRIAGPDPLGLVALNQLSDARFDPPPLLPHGHRDDVSQPQRPSLGLALLGLVGCQEMKDPGAQLCGQPRAPVVAIPHGPTASTIQKVFSDREIMDIGRRQAKEEPFVGVDPQEGAHHFNRQNLAIGQFGLRASSAALFTLEPIVEQAKMMIMNVIRSMARPPLRFG